MWLQVFEGKSECKSTFSRFPYVLPPSISGIFFDRNPNLAKYYLLIKISINNLDFYYILVTSSYSFFAKYN